MTGAGIVFSTAFSLPKKASRIAKIAAILIYVTSVAFVRATAPITSAYVVLGGPPTNEAKEEAIPSPKRDL